jgi:hypothetical protein
MKITIYVTGTANPQRVSWLKESIDATDKQNFLWHQKILSIDEFDGYTFPIDMKQYFESNGWTVIIDQFKSRVKTFDKVLNNYIAKDTDLIFYNEDDIIPFLPTLEEVTQVFNTEIDGKKCGILSLNYGGSEGNQYPNTQRRPGDIAFANQNEIISNNDWIIFKRLTEMANSWFFEFPALFVDKTLFINTFNTTYQTIRGQIETALTHTFFRTEMHNKYYKCSRLRKNCVELCNEDMTRHQEILSLKLLDANQGCSCYIGNSDF